MVTRSRFFLWFLSRLCGGICNRVIVCSLFSLFLDVARMYISLIRKFLLRVAKADATWWTYSLSSTRFSSKSACPSASSNRVPNLFDRIVQLVYIPEFLDSRAYFLPVTELIITKQQFTLETDAKGSECETEDINLRLRVQEFGYK